jgi:hypothetical protein
MSVFVSGGAEVHAKKVKIEWQKIEGSTLYEVQIQKDGKQILNKTTDDPYWKGSLDPGIYSYQIRAIDEMQRPGDWTGARALVVAPPGPNMKFPVSGEKVSLYSPHAPVILKWEPVPGLKKYSVQLKRDGKTIYKSDVMENELTLRQLQSGQYTWQVNGVLQSSTRSPAALQGKKWETLSDNEESFTLEQKHLESPRQIEPLSTNSIPDDGKIRLRWKSVDGAEAYEVRLIKVQSRSLGRSLSRSIASDLEKAKAYVTRDTSMVSRVPGSGTYLWGVRALAHIDEKTHVPAATGPQSQTEFSLDRNAVFNDDLGYLALSTMLAPYSYKISSPTKGIEGSTQSSAVVLRLSGEIWYAKQWGISAAVDYASFQMLQQTFGRKSFELLSKYRTKFGTGKYGWSISPKLGAEMREYAEVIPGNIFQSPPQITITQMNVIGASLGLDIRKQFNEKLSMGAKFGYFYPLMLSGAPSGSSLGGSASSRNLNFGLQGLYWLNQNVGLGVGGFFEMRSIGFTSPGVNGVEEIYMDGTYFFGSVVYRFLK